MKIIIGGASNKTRIALVFTALLLVASVLGLATAAYQKNRGSEDKTASYLYQVYGGQSEDEEQPDGADGAHTVLVLGKDFDSNRTDAIICVAFKANGGVSTLQIPRDTYVEDGSYKGRINGLLPVYRAEAIEKGDSDPTDTGIRKLMEKIERDFGISCQSYVFMDIGGLEAITDVLGGVTVDIPADIDYTDRDRDIDLHLKAGSQQLDGKTAVQFVRYRQGYPQADIGRINAQKLFAAAMLDKLQGLSSVSTAVRLADVMASYVKTNLGAEETARLATKLCMAKGDEVVMYTMPGDGVSLGGGSYYGVFADKLCEVLEKGFDVSTDVFSLKTQDFSAKSGGYRDTEGVTLSSILEKGLAIPVYSD